MHCLFLGIAKWIVTRLWIEENKLITADLTVMQKRVDKIQVPTDIGRLSRRINIGEGFSSFSADQWKTFILIYATTTTWDLLEEADQKILANFIRACSILVCRLVSKNDLIEAHQRLIVMVKEIERTYRPKKITSNLHLCIHLCECMLNYGPLYTFWYYSMERMNGLLGLFQNSHKRIESELMKIIQNNALLDKLTSRDKQNQHFQENLEILKLKDSVRSLSTYDEYPDEEYRTFHLLSTKIAEEEFQQLLAEFYCNAYNKEFVTLSRIHKTAESSIPVDPNVNQFSRLRIRTEIFGSTLSSRHAKLAKILAHFFIDDNTSDIYL
ncbi:15763_t:CDS:2, partial [Funneliformis geosporum]